MFKIISTFLFVTSYYKESHIEKYLNLYKYELVHKVKVIIDGNVLANMKVCSYVNEYVSVSVYIILLFGKHTHLSHGFQNNVIRMPLMCSQLHLKL